MSHVCARLNRFNQEGDLSRKRTVERVDVEVDWIASMFNEGKDSSYIAMPTYVLVGLALGFLGFKRGLLSADQLRLLDDACKRTQLAIPLVFSRLDVETDNWKLARNFAAPFADILSLFADFLNHSALKEVIWIAYGALVETAAWYFETDPDFHPDMLHLLCVDIDRFVVDGDLNSTFEAIGTIHDACDLLTNETYRLKVDCGTPTPFAASRLLRLRQRLAGAHQDPVDQEHIEILEAVVMGAAVFDPESTPTLN